MKARQITATQTIPSSERLVVHGFLTMLLAVAVALGSILSGGCVAAPAVLVSSAAVTAAGLIAEGERAVQDSDRMDSVVATSDTDVDLKPATVCPPDEAPGAKDQVGTFRQHEKLNARADHRDDGKGTYDSGRPKT